MTGGCLCGAVRYETTGDSFGVIPCGWRGWRNATGRAVVPRGLVLAE